jgi:hypothetical protein
LERNFARNASSICEQSFKPPNNGRIPQNGKACGFIRKKSKGAKKMTNKQHLELNLKRLKSDRNEMSTFNDPSISESPPFSEIIYNIVQLEIKRLESELLNYK